MEKQEIFTNDSFGSLQVITIEGKEFFPATDCARILGYKNPQKAIREHCKGVNEMVTPSVGGEQKKKFIPEGDLYRLIVRSKLPSAEKFEKWVFEDVLPSIRKHGLYATDELLANPDLLIKLATDLKNEREEKNKLKIKNESLQIENEEKDNKIIQLKPKAEYTDKMLKSNDSILIREYCKILQETNSWFNLGEKKTYALLREIKILNNKNEPYQSYMKYFDIIERTYNNGYGDIRITTTTKVNTKGQLYLYKRIKKYLLQNEDIKEDTV
jgi:anti-repressor protein